MSSKAALIAALISYVTAQIQIAQFNSVVNLNGDMNLNSVQFPDGSKIETFSQTQRQLLVNQNTAPLPGNQVTGSTGNPFIQLTQSSTVIQTNGATDLVGGQIELPFNTTVLKQNNISPDNTFVAKLAPDRSSWVIQETIKSVNNTDNTVRLVKLNAIDGEYIALGRATNSSGVVLSNFSNARIDSFNVTGSGIQENEFTDGFRLSVRAAQPMIINTNVVNGISTTMLSALGPGVGSVNNFRYQVNTNLAGVVPNINRMVAVVQIPVNPSRLIAVAQAMGVTGTGNIIIGVAQRGVLANPGGAQAIIKRQEGGGEPKPEATSKVEGKPEGSQPTPAPEGQQPKPEGPQSASKGEGQTTAQGEGQTPSSRSSSSASTSITTAIIQNNNPAATRLLLSPTFTPIAAPILFDQANSRIVVPVTQLDGEYIITIQKAEGNAGPAPPAGEGAAPSASSSAALEGSSKPAGEPTSPAGEAAKSTSLAESKPSTSTEGAAPAEAKTTAVEGSPSKSAAEALTSAPPGEKTSETPLPKLASTVSAEGAKAPELLAPPPATSAASLASKAPEGLLPSPEASPSKAPEVVPPPIAKASEPTPAPAAPKPAPPPAGAIGATGPFGIPIVARSPAGRAASLMQMVKRQIGSLVGAPPAPLSSPALATTPEGGATPAAPAPPTAPTTAPKGSGVTVSLALVNQLIASKNVGDTLNANAIINQFAAQSGGAAAPVGGLTGGLVA